MGKKIEICLVLFIALGSFFVAGTIFDLLPDDYFPAGRPTYLPSPIRYTEDLGMCGLVGNSTDAKDSFCNSTILLSIKTTIQDYATNISNSLNDSLGNLRDSFNTVGNLLWRRFEADKKPFDGLKIALDKILIDYRVRQQGIGREMANCMNTVTQVMAGFLCAACNVSANPYVIRSSILPLIHIKNTTVAAIEKNCTRLMKMISESVDLYHRTKMMVVDMLTAEMGSQTHVCTCTGEAVNYTAALSYNSTGVYRDLAENEYLLTATNWDPYVNETSMVADDVIAMSKACISEKVPLTLVNNTKTLSSDSVIETYASDYLKSNISYVKGGKLKDWKFKALSDFTRFSFMVGEIFNRTIQKRSFMGLYRELNQILDVTPFTFDEIRTMATGFINSFQTVLADPKKIGLIYKLYLKLLVDFLLRPPPSASFSQFVAANKTAFIIASYGAALLKFAKGFMFESKTMGVGVCAVPYINLLATTASNMIAYYPCGSGIVGFVCNLDNLAACEAQAVRWNKNNVILAPYFRVLRRVDRNMTFFGNLINTFGSAYKDISQVDRDFRSYMMMQYFPPHYFRVNTDERKLPKKTTQALEAETYYNDKIIKTLTEVYEDCLGYIKESPPTVDLLREIMRAQKDAARSDQLLRFYNSTLTAEDYVKLTQYELNKRKASYFKKCLTTDECKIGYIDRDFKPVEVQLPVKTILNPDYAIMEQRILNGYLGMTSIGEMNEYNDEENVALAKCSRLISARTLLCVEPAEQDLLAFGNLEAPPDYSNLTGAELTALIFTKYKFLSLLDFAYPLKTNTDDLTSGDSGKIPNDPIVIIDDEKGLDLLSPVNITATVNESLLTLEYNFTALIPLTPDTTSDSSYLHLPIFLLTFLILVILI